MKKSHIFASENDNEPTALATFPKNGIPVLSGEVAERFLRIANENEERAKKRKNKPITKEEAESVIDIFKSAIADENEIYDMFGIKFSGNERLKRLYMPEGWEGHPLRKDYTEKDSRLAWNDDNNA